MRCPITRLAANTAIVISYFMLCAGPGIAQANTITVNSLLDDVFPSASGAIFDINGLPITLASSKCTLRMAIASANLDNSVPPVPNGCAVGSGADTIVFDAALNLANTPGTITLANKAMSEAPAIYSDGNSAALAVAGPLTITGPGSTRLTIDGVLVAADGRRILIVSDGNQNNDAPVALTGIRFYRGRTVDFSAGCMFSFESITLVDVTFEDCESTGGPNNPGRGGALGVGELLAGSTAANVSISNSAFVGNRALRGTSSGRSEDGALFIGSSTRKAGAVTLNNVLLNGNSAERQGAMHITNASSVHISASHFIGNVATGSVNGTATDASGSGRYGGFRIDNISGDVTIDNYTRVNGNVANEERGGFGVRTIGGTVTIDLVEVSGNYVNRGQIGGFEILTDSVDDNDNCPGLKLRPVNITNMRIQANSVASTIGGFLIACSGVVTMTNAYVVRNETRGYRLARTDTVANTLSAGYLAPATDATAAQSTATLTNIVFEGNETNAAGNSGSGIGVFLVSGLGTFTGDTLRFIDNSVDGPATLVLSAQGAGRNYLITNTEIADNHTTLQAAGLFVQTDGNYTLRNSTVSANSANDAGIVMANVNTNTPNGISLAIENSTIARNQASTGDALIVFASANQPNPGVATPTFFGGSNATIAIRNSILGTRAPGYTGTGALVLDGPHGVTNVIASNTLLEWNGGVPASICSGTGMKCNVGALLSPLARNGDASDQGMRTMALLAGSPAIDAGGPVLNGLTTDQRGAGYPRINGSAVDIGAYESDPASTRGCTLDLDGNNILDALSDGLVLIRALFGLTGTPATTGAIGAGASRPDWTSIRNYLNANCGTKFGP